MAMTPPNKPEQKEQIIPEIEEILKDIERRNAETTPSQTRSKQMTSRAQPPARTGNGPQLPQPRSFDELAREVDRAHPIDETEHPALIACKKAADMVRSVVKAHSEQGETLAKHIEHIGETFMGLCKEAADRIRAERILPEEMSNKTADELEHMGRTEAKRQARVKHGLTAARDAIIGIDTASGHDTEETQ
jgi:hypothetical protein